MIDTGDNGDDRANPPDSQGEQPEIYSIHKENNGIMLNRRSFLSAAAAAALVGGLGIPASLQAATITGSCGFAHADAVTSIAISPDGNTLVSGAKDKTVKIWRISDMKLLKTLSSEPGRVTAVAAGPDGKSVVAGADDKTIRIWELPSGKILNTITASFSSIMMVAISPDGKRLIAGSRYTPLIRLTKNKFPIQLWDLPEGKFLKDFTETSCSSLAMSMDGKVLALGCSEHAVRLWSLEEDKLLNTLDSGPGTVTAVAISSDGKCVIAGTSRHKIMLWKTREGGRSPEPDPGFSENVPSVLALSPDEKYLVYQSKPGKITMKKLREGRMTDPWTRELHSDSITALAFSRDGKIFATASKDKTIRLWEMPSLRQLGCLADDSLSPPDGQRRDERQIMGGVVCTCDKVCTCNTVCSCVSVCSCVGHISSGSGGRSHSGGSHYWRPN